MKITFKKSIIAFTVFSLLGVSAFAYAQNDNFCSKITSLGLKVSQMIAEKTDKLDLKRSERDKKLGEKRTEIDQKLGENRLKWDENRTEQYTKLEEKADTDAKKQALAVFKGAVDKAIADRRSAINSAQDAFRSGINQLLESRGTKVDQLTTEYRKAIEDAIKKAESECTAGEKLTIRQDLMNVLKVARQKFNSDKQGIDKLGEQVKTLTDARKAAFEKAKADFKTAVEKARADLKTAFGSLAVPSPSPTVEP